MASENPLTGGYSRMVGTVLGAAGTAALGIAHQVVGRFLIHRGHAAGPEPRIAVEPDFLTSMRTLYGPDTADRLFVDLGAEAARIADGFDPDAIDWTTGHRRDDA